MKERYKQEFSRVLNVFENVMITLSCVSPAASVFIITPIAIAGFGTATFLSYVGAALIGVAMALCWAELGSTYPFAGGDYSIVTRAVGDPWGFANIALNMATMFLVLPVFALGLGSYLTVLFEADAKLVGTVAILAATLIAMLNVRLGAAITGAFLLIELIALVIISYLGFVHIERPFTELLHPVVLDTAGTPSAASFGLIMSGVAVAIFGYDGYRVTILLSEEMRASGRGIARATLWALFATVAAVLIPTTAVLLGAKSIAELGKAPDLTPFVTDRGGPLLNTIVSLGIAAAIFNALIAIIVVCARGLFSVGRDRAWPQGVNRLLTKVHPRFNSPWVATLALGLISAIVTPFCDVNVVGTFLGANATVTYMMIAVAAIGSRIKHPDRPRPYRMPLWPLPPVVALAAMAYVMTQQGAGYLWASGGIAALALAYYFLYLAPRAGSRWIIKEAPDSVELEPERGV